jgi:hypothetical protein
MTKISSNSKPPNLAKQNWMKHSSAHRRAPTTAGLEAVVMFSLSRSSWHKNNLKSDCHSGPDILNRFAPIDFGR